MASNPLVTQGTLNRVLATVSWPSFPSLNVTLPYLGKEGITLTLQGEATTMIPTLSGAVTSPEPYMMIELSMHLLRTQPLGAAYKAQMELSTPLGDGVVRPDSTSLPPYDIFNCAITGVQSLKFAGEDPGFMVTVRGYYVLNSSLFS